MKLPTAEQMRRLDKTTIEDYGIPGIILMENAGRQTANVITGFFPLLRDRERPKKEGEVLCCNRKEDHGPKIVIFVGPGNNGGDGLVIARHMQQTGAKVKIFLLADPDKIRGDAAINLKIVQQLGLPLKTILSDDDLVFCDQELLDDVIIVDAVFGTGLSSEVKGLPAEVIKRINASNCPVVSVDIPSGLDADNGLPLGICVQADFTVTLALPKPGLVISPGSRFAGHLEVVDIGIPREAIISAPIQRELLDQETVASWLSSRNPEGHKGTFGHLFIMAGSVGKTGAAILCAEGALRSGTGLVSLGVPQELNPIFATRLVEAMTIPLPQGPSGALFLQDGMAIKEAIKGKTAMVIGPGLGLSPDSRELVIRLFQEIPLPMVVDADALTILAQDPRLLKDHNGPRILTPHPGEMGRLKGKTGREIQARRLESAEALAGECGVIVVLKGAGTIIAGPDGCSAVNPTGNPGMATGGMGDVLAGVIGGLLAQGLSPWQASCLGTFVHGRAGDFLAQERPFGFLASELAAALPRVFQEVKGG